MLEGKKVEIKLGGNFDPVPMDKYTCLVSDVNLVEQKKFQSTENEEVLNYRFTILDDKPMEVTKEDGEVEQGTTRGRYLWKRCRLALGKQSWLRKFAEAVVGRTLTKEELETFDPESVVNHQVDVMVEQTAKDEKVYVNIVSFGKTVKQLEPLKDEEVKKTGQVVEKQTVPATAPDADNEADDVIAKVNAEKEAAVGETPDDVAELEAKLAAAKAKAAKAKA